MGDIWQYITPDAKGKRGRPKDTDSTAIRAKWYDFFNLSANSWLLFDVRCILNTGLMSKLKRKANPWPNQRSPKGMYVVNQPPVVELQWTMIYLRVSAGL